MKDKIRLDKLLANLGYGSRRTVQHYFHKGLVTLDGKVQPRGEEHISLTPDLRDRLQVEGEALDPLPGFVVLMHKPVGVTCSHKEEHGDLVYSLLPERWRAREPALSTVGRLDKDTSGLLLLTDDGVLLHKIIAPKREIKKRYRAELERPLRGDEGELFASGTLLLEGEKKPLLPATLEALSPTTAYLTVSEGRYHQVRRMFALAGNVVKTLHRERVGGLSLPDDLPPGKFRVLAQSDVDFLFINRSP